VFNKNNRSGENLDRSYELPQESNINETALRKKGRLSKVKKKFEKIEVTTLAQAIYYLRKGEMIAYLDWDRELNLMREESGQVAIYTWPKNKIGLMLGAYHKMLRPYDWLEDNYSRLSDRYYMVHGFVLPPLDAPINPVKRFLARLFHVFFWY